MSSSDVDHCVFAVDDGAAYRYVRRIRGEMLDEADERLPPVWKRIPAGSDSPLATPAAPAGRRSSGRRAAAAIAADRHDAQSGRWPRCRCARRRCAAP